MDSGALVPLVQIVVTDPTDLPQARRDDPGPCLLLVPGAGAPAGVAGPTGRAGPRPGVGGCDPGPGSVAGGGSGTGRQAVPAAERGAGHVWEGVPGSGSGLAPDRPTSLADHLGGRCCA